jgi:hypothetical protein
MAVAMSKTKPASMGKRAQMLIDGGWADSACGREDSGRVSRHPPNHRHCPCAGASLRPLCRTNPRPLGHGAYEVMSGGCGPSAAPN